MVSLVYIYMDIGGPSGRGHSRKRTRGARTGRGAVMTYVPRGNATGQAQASSTGSGIGPMPTQTSSRRLSHLTGSWKRENNVPLSLNYRENPGPTPGIINASSTILEAFFVFCFFTVEVKGWCITCYINMYNNTVV